MSILQYTIIIMLTVLLSYVQVFVLGNYTTSELFAPSSLYHLQIALATPLVLHYDEEIAQRLSFIVNDAVNAANAHHLRQPANFTNSFGHRGRSDGIEVKILRRLQLKNQTVFYFIAYHNDKPIPGNIIKNDMDLLSLQHMSAILQYPVSGVSAQENLNELQSTSWWIVAAVIGSGILILCFGWCLLFIYYNLCGIQQQNSYDISKTVYQKQEATQIDSCNTYDNKNERSQNEKRFDETMKADKLKERSSTCNMKSSSEATASFVPVLCNGVISVNQAKDETNGMQSSISEDLQKSSKNNGDDFVVTTDENNVKKTMYHEELRYSEEFKDDEIPHVEDSPRFNNEGKRFSTKQLESVHSNRPVRPKAARERPIRKCDEFLYNMNETGWSHYYAADAISSIYSINSCSAEHPSPAQPVQDGVLQLSQPALNNTTLSML